MSSDMHFHVLHGFELLQVTHLFSLFLRLEPLLFGLLVGLPLDTGTLPAWWRIGPILLVGSRALLGLQIKLRLDLSTSAKFSICHDLLDDGASVLGGLELRRFVDADQR